MYRERWIDIYLYVYIATRTKGGAEGIANELPSADGHERDDLSERAEAFGRIVMLTNDSVVHKRSG